MTAVHDPARYARLKDLHFELDVLDDDARAARLQALEAQEPELAEALRRRFSRQQRPLDILDRAERPVRESAAPRLPGYRVLRELGRGGMGRVWLAERRLDDTSQLVALKQIAAAHWGDEDERRFQRERRILASLDHPNIAALIDGGRDGQGAPYLSTAFVNGERLDRWCEQRHAPRRERVRLIRDLAAAIAYAHRQLVVHRDLKPANILVTEHGVAKLLDFGIARVLGEDELTATGASQMTLRYAAPEQVQGAGAGGIGIDIYALGVLLYELLAGASPYGQSEGSAAQIHAILNLEPVAPTRVRGPRDLDLDAICLKALRKLPEQRYGSADALQQDLDAWLAGKPVEARRGERGYRLRAVLRRHWLALTVGLAVVVSAAGFAAFHIAALDRQLAETLRERDKARAVSQYFQELFASANPSDTQAGELTAKELLARSVARLEQGDTTGMDDDARASMFHAAGRIMRAQGLADEAQHMYERALAIWLQQPVVPEDDIADVYNELALVQFGRGNYDQTLALLQKALARRDAMGDRNSTQRGVLLQQLSVTLRSMGRNAEATEALAESVAVLAQQLPEARANYAVSLANLGTFRVTEGQAEDGRDKLEQALAQLAMLTPERTAVVLAVRRNHAMSLRELGRYADAEREYAAVLARLREFFGPEHVELARTQHSLAQGLLLQGRLDEAEQALREAERIEAALGHPEDPRVLAYRADRARIQIERGDFAAAIALLQPVLVARAAGVVSERSNVHAERAALAYAQCRLQPETAQVAMLREAIDGMAQTPPLPRALIAQANAWAEACEQALGRAAR